MTYLLNGPSGSTSQDIWTKLSKLYLKNLFSTYPKFIKEYEALLKRQATSPRDSLTGFLPAVLELFGNKFASLSFDVVAAEVKVCEKLLEHLCICLSTSQCRLPTLMLLQDRQFYLKNTLFFKYLKIKWADEHSAKDRLQNLFQLFLLLKRFVNYDILGESRIAKRTLLVHYDTFQEFQRLLFHHFADKVEHYVVKAVGNTDTREKMAEIFSYLTEGDLRLLANKLNIFVPDEEGEDPVLQILTEQSGYKIIVEEILISRLKAREAYLQQVKALPLYPNETDLYSYQTSQLVQQQVSMDYRDSFALDRLTNSFTNFEDYLFRHLTLWRSLFSFETRQQVESIVPTLNPEFDSSTATVKEFGGWTPFTLEIKSFTVYEVAKAKIGSTASDHILAEVDYSTVEINAVVKKDWETLKAHDTLFLLAFSRRDQSIISDEVQGRKPSSNLALVRGCELLAHLDEERNKINANEFRKKTEIKAKGTRRHLQLHLDPRQYALDLSSDSKVVRDGAYSIVMKRHAHAPLYSTYLRFVLRFLEQGTDLPGWVNAVVVGKSYPSLKDKGIHNELEGKVSITSLFQDAAHYKQAFTDNKHLEPLSSLIEPVSAFTAREHTGVRLSAEQVEAVVKSTQPGVILIKGPPGSGKSTLCTEITRVALNNYPQERVVIVTQTEAEVSRVLSLLSRVSSISEDQIMRLGDAVEHSQGGIDYSRSGRVDYMLKLRLGLLEQAEEIASSIGMPLNSHLTCETAEIFFQSQILSRWSEYTASLKTATLTKESHYPFGSFSFIQHTYLRRKTIQLEIHNLRLTPAKKGTLNQKLTIGQLRKCSFNFEKLM